MKGYNRTFYTTTDKHEYIRVDFNIKERRIRLYLEDNDEGGNPYYSVITDGKITVERNATTGRTADLFDKFAKRADILSTIPSQDVLRLINHNYGIGQSERERAAAGSKIGKESKKAEQVIIPAAKASERGRAKSGTGAGKRKRYFFTDIIDIFIGIVLCAALFSFNRNFVTLGVLSAFIGIFIGLLDVYYRERRIILIKMLLFLLAGVIFYIYGYYIV